MIDKREKVIYNQLKIKNKQRLIIINAKKSVTGNTRGGRLHEDKSEQDRSFETCPKRTVEKQIFIFDACTSIALFLCF